MSVALMYVSSAPIALADFARTHLEAGETARVRLQVRPTSMAVVDPVGRRGWTLEPCTITVYAGGRQPSSSVLPAAVAVVAATATSRDVVQTATMQLVGAALPLAHCPVGSAGGNFVQ